jgi:undecaprenyl phosphate-alpha-L-ara4N flippase subunit ArnE
MSVGLTVVANLLLRAGLDRAGGFPARVAEIPAGLLRLGAQPFFDLGMALYVAAMLVWFRVLATLQLTLAYPIVMSLNFVLVTLAAVMLFRESFSMLKAIGLIVILAGIYILSRG